MAFCHDGIFAAIDSTNVQQQRNSHHLEMLLTSRLQLVPDWHVCYSSIALSLIIIFGEVTNFLSFASGKRDLLQRYDFTLACCVVWCWSLKNCSQQLFVDSYQKLLNIQEATNTFCSCSQCVIRCWMDLLFDARNKKRKQLKHFAEFSQRFFAKL